ncbi:MAG: DUF934 domain-containing protein [Gammaproteobacteria bacterium]
MPNLIRGNELAEDAWQVLTADSEIDELPVGDIIVPLTLWRAPRDALLARAGRVGLWLECDDEPEEIADDVESLPLIAVNFPTFSDGRAVSSAVLLRGRSGFKGELRAVGDVRRDWLSYMRRCGFDAYQMASEQEARSAIDSLVVMSDYYQGSVVEPSPLFRRVQRSWAEAPSEPQELRARR